MRMYRPILATALVASLFSFTPAMAATQGSSSSAKLKTTTTTQVTPRRAIKPSRRQQAQTSSTSAKATSAKKIGFFPINLLQNSQWKIRITGSEESYLGTQTVLEVTRKNEKISVQGFDKDLRSGKLTKSSESYRADFARGYLSDDEYLEVQYCWYKYEYIREGFSCHFNRIPVVVTQSSVKGDDSYEFLITGAYDDFTVDILSKSDKETPCTIRAGLHEGQKLYYTKDSEFFKEPLSEMMCFDSEKAATAAGYQKSFK